MRYRLNTGFFAFILNRLSGILLVFFILPHFFIVYFLRDPAKYEAIRHFCGQPAVKISEIGVLCLVLAHGGNGIRLMLLEGGVPTKFQKAIFWAAFGLGLLVLAIGAKYMMGF